MTVTGPDFIALQVADLQRSAQFYETRLGLRRAAAGPPHAVVFDTSPIAFAVREPLPDFDPESAQPHAGAGVVLWLHAEDPQALHDELAAAGVTIVTPPTQSPFGLMFVFEDPDGYHVTLHSRA